MRSFQTYQTTIAVRRAVLDEGASSVEYGLIVAAIAAVIALIVFTFGLVNQSTYADSCDAIAGQVSGTDCPGN